MSEDYQAIASVLARTFEPDRDPTYTEIKLFRRFERLYGRALNLELTLPMLSSWYSLDLSIGVQDV